MQTPGQQASTLFHQVAGELQGTTAATKASAARSAGTATGRLQSRGLLRRVLHLRITSACPNPSAFESSLSAQHVLHGLHIDALRQHRVTYVGRRVPDAPLFLCSVLRVQTISLALRADETIRFVSADRTRLGREEGTSDNGGVMLLSSQQMCAPAA